MFFRNLFLFTLPDSPQPDPAQLETALAAHALQPVGALAMHSHGFVPPLGSGAFVQRSGDSLWLSLGGEERILPAAVVQRELQRKLADTEQAKGRPAGKRERGRLKQETIDELMPRAFVKPSRINALINRKAGFIAVDTASAKAAERVVGRLRDALGSFRALPLQAAQAPRSQLTRFLLGQDLPARWELGEECELQDPAEKGALVKCLRHDLASDEVRTHLAAGKQVSRLGVLFDGRQAFVLGEDLVLRKYRLLAGAVDTLETADGQSAEDELMARFTLFGAELDVLYAGIADAFGLHGEAPKAIAA